MTDDRIVEFFRMIPEIRLPKRAERSAAGYLPSRGMRYCDALTSATGYGYWVFPPIDIRLQFDGEEVFWSYGDIEEWLPLSGTDAGAVQFPDYAAAFDAAAPPELTGYAPPFLTALPELGGVQIWSGLLARTRPGWSLSIRSPVNLPLPPGVVPWEGIVETDLWFGPLFSNIRITRTNVPVFIRAAAPFMQVQPVPQIAYREETLASYRCQEVGDLAERDWKQLAAVLTGSGHGELQQGSYAVAVRKRRLCPYDPKALLAPGPDDAG